MARCADAKGLDAALGSEPWTTDPGAKACTTSRYRSAGATSFAGSAFTFARTLSKFSAPTQLAATSAIHDAPAATFDKREEDIDSPNWFMRLTSQSGGLFPG